MANMYSRPATITTSHEMKTTRMATILLRRRCALLRPAVASVVELVDDGVALAAADQPTVDRGRHHERQCEGRDE
jgi:hypothetical protein